MKRIVLSIAYIMSCMLIYAQKININETLLTETHSWDLEYIELFENYTLCKWRVTSICPDTYVYMTKDAYLEDALTGKKYSAIDVEGIPYEPEWKIIEKQYEYVDFIVRFEPISKDVEKIHYISSSSFQIRNMELTRTKPNAEVLVDLLSKAKQYNEREDYKMEVEIYKMITEKVPSVGIAEYNLANSYMKGIGVTRDMRQAAFWAKKSAQAYFSAGCLLYANLCFEGIGTKRNLVESAKWMLKAAESGSAQAQCYMGMNYDAGTGVKQNYIEAAKWYRKAAEQGNSSAANNLAHLYAVGKGVEVNFSEAGRWFLFAAEGGDVNAQYTIGLWYLNGYQGWEQNRSVGIKWLKTAANNGNVDAKIKLAEVN